ncbi:SNF2-related protein [Alicyclobacillus contaminans]|uniref:DEAD/DEAH box helicase n=1 Tax=Alicyclobacillus contaminans TaxID=392016 RepID=UPI000A05A427
MPPVVWHGQEVQAAFTAYLEKADVGNQAAWTLFGLNVTATKARLARDFDELLVLEHIRGFTPLPHQVETARRVMQELHGRAILADEVGLGKTIEAGLIMKEYLLRGLARKILVLVPASLVLQWTRELNDKFRIPAYAQRNEWNWTQADVVVGSLDTAKREPHRSAVLEVEWDLVVVDEAHKLKNNRTKNWQMVNQIPNKYMLLLTATPMQNDLKELHTLITLLRPGHLGSRQEFASQHMANARQPRDAKELKSQLGHVMIRNRRRDGATNLPKRHVTAVPLELSPAERKLYDAVQQFLKQEYDERTALRRSVLPLITLQREICSSPYAAMHTLERMGKRATSESLRQRIAELMTLAQQVTTYTKVDKVLEMIASLDDKCIVFTEYRATQELLLYMLRKRGVSAVPFRGGFKRGKKDWMKDLFASKMKVLVATESGGEGINLQFCHHMINFDLPWNPMRLEQRIGRIHRLGQEREVHIYNLATRDTIEAHIVHLLQEKIRMFEMVIGELDYIVDDPKLSSKLEEKILEWSMTSESNGELVAKLEQYGDEWLQQVKESTTR